MNTPRWAQDLTINAILYLHSSGRNAELPDIKWRRAQRLSSSGVTYPDHIRIVAGTSRIDCKMIILHELVHWIFPLKSEGHIYGHEGHTPRFWDLAWELYRWAKLPVRYCLNREAEYRKGAVLAYRRRVNEH